VLRSQLACRAACRVARRVARRVRLDATWHGRLETATSRGTFGVRRGSGQMWRAVVCSGGPAYIGPFPLRAIPASGRSRLQWAEFLCANKVFRRWVRHFQILNEHDGFLIESDSTLMHVSTASHGAPVCSAYMIAYRRLHVAGSCGPCRNVCCMLHVACCMSHVQCCTRAAGRRCCAGSLGVLGGTHQ